MVRMVSVLAGVVALAACNGGTDENAGEQPLAPSATEGVAAEPSDAATARALAQRASNGARSVSEETDDYLFEYAYPAQAGRIEALGLLLDGHLDEQRSELARTSAEAREQARSDGFPYNKHSYTAEWKVVTDIPGWLSLSNDFSTYSGGAHGMYGMESLVWDKTNTVALKPIDLFVSPAALQTSWGERFCAELDKQRAKKRVPEAEQEESSGLTSFTDCPKIDELTVLVGSASGRRFDRITLYAGPYVAGPYVEGAYQVNLRIDNAMLQAVKPEYRESFASRN